VTTAGTDQSLDTPAGTRWRSWADATTAVGVVIAVLLLARGALAFTIPVALRLAGGGFGLPDHVLVWLRLLLPAAVVVVGLLGWWLPATAVAWSAVVLELVLDPGLVPLTLTTVLAVALSVPGGFRRGRMALGALRLWLVAAAAAIVGLGTPAVMVASGEVIRVDGFGPGFAPGFAIDSRINAAIKVGQYVVVGLALVLAAGSLARHLRWRALSVIAVVATFVATSILADRAPFDLWLLPRLDPTVTVAVGGAIAVAMAAVLVTLVERRLDE